MAKQNAGVNARLNRLADQLGDHLATKMEAIDAEVIDQPLGAQEQTLEQRVADFRRRALDDGERQQLWDEETGRAGLDAFDPQQPGEWQPPRSVINYLKARLKDLKALEEQESR